MFCKQKSICAYFVHNLCEVRELASDRRAYLYRVHFVRDVHISSLSFFYLHVLFHKIQSHGHSYMNSIACPNNSTVDKILCPRICQYCPFPKSSKLRAMATEPPPANTFETILVRTYHSPLYNDSSKCVLTLETCSRLWEPVCSSPFRTQSK